MKKFLILSIVSAVVALAGLLYAADGFSSYKTNLANMEGNQQSYEEYLAAGDTVNASRQMDYATEAAGRVAERKTQMLIGVLVFLVSGAAAGVTYRKREN